MDDAYRLEKFVAMLAEMRALGSSAESQEGTAAHRPGQLPADQEREELLFDSLLKLESVEMLAQAMNALGEQSAEHNMPRSAMRESSESEDETHPHQSTMQSGARSSPSTQSQALVLSASFQERVCELCRERADRAETAGISSSEAEAGRDLMGHEASIAALRFRASTYDLYRLLKSVEIHPAGADGEAEGGDPAFLPPGRRGWRYTLLAEEAAGWAEMAHRHGRSRGAALMGAELPEFQVISKTPR